MIDTLDTPTEVRRRRAFDVTIGTHNAGKEPDYSVVMDMLNDGVNVLGLQECADQTPEDFDLHRHLRRVGMHWPLTPAINPATGEKFDGGANVRENPIVWDKRIMRLHRSGSTYLTAPEKVGAAGAGGDRLHAKFLNWVSLTHLALGETIVVGNVHTVPSIKLNDVRGDLMRRQVQGMVDWAALRRSTRIVTIVGDTNANIFNRAEAKFLAPLLDAGFESCWTATNTPGGSLGNRAIDQIMLRNHERAEFRAMDVLHSRGFDHKPVQATIRVTQR